MPTQRSNKNRWGLPANLEPIGTRCLSVFVPDDPEWIALFTGAIYRLSQQIWYDRDAQKSAKIVARKWLDVYLNLMERMRTGEAGCNVFDIRIKPDNPCTIQKSFDGGETWVDAIDMSQCWKAGIKRDPRTGQFGYYDGIDFYRFPDGAWVDDPQTWFPPPPANRTGAEQDIRCDASYGAALALQQLYRETWDVFTNFVTLGVLEVSRILAEAVNFLTNGWIDLAYMVDRAVQGYQQSSNFTDGGFPDSAIETVQNILFCNSSIQDGAVIFDFDAVIAEFSARVEPNPYNGLNALLNLFLGEDGLNAAGGVKAGSGDCTSAECFPPCGSGTIATLDIPYDDLSPTGVSTQCGGQLGGTWSFSSTPNDIIFTLPSHLCVTRVEFMYRYIPGVAGSRVTNADVLLGDQQIQTAYVYFGGGTGCSSVVPYNSASNPIRAKTITIRAYNGTYIGFRTLRVQYVVED